MHATGEGAVDEHGLAAGDVHRQCAGVRGHEPRGEEVSAAPRAAAGEPGDELGNDAQCERRGLRALARCDVLAREPDAGGQSCNARSASVLRGRDLSLRSDEGNGETLLRRHDRTAKGNAAAVPRRVRSREREPVRRDRGRLRRGLPRRRLRREGCRPTARCVRVLGDRPSAEVPSPKSQRYAAASPVAEKATRNGAAPAVGVA